jgi:hypothetical protein
MDFGINHLRCVFMHPKEVVHIRDSSRLLVLNEIVVIRDT